MFEQLLSDWRFLAAIAGLLVIVGEARYKLRRHEVAINNMATSETTQTRNNATMVAELKGMSEDVRELKGSMSRFSEKYDIGTARVWTSLEDAKERLAKLEGKMTNKT